MPPSRLLSLALLALTLSVAQASAADPEAGRRKAEPCGRCHGVDGNATIPGTPSLAGQPAWFTHWALIKFREGRRKDAQMSPFGTGLTDADLADLSAYYATLPPRPRRQPVDRARVAEGSRLATAYHCMSCHRPDLSGQHHVPRLAGQDMEYLRRQLRAYRAQTASDLDGAMTAAAQPLSDEDVEHLVHYMASVGATAEGAGSGAACAGR